jgi:hypothetical protein
MPRYVNLFENFEQSNNAADLADIGLLSGMPALALMIDNDSDLSPVADPLKVYVDKARTSYQKECSKMDDDDRFSGPSPAYMDFHNETMRAIKRMVDVVAGLGSIYVLKTRGEDGSIGQMWTRKRPFVVIPDVNPWRLHKSSANRVFWYVKDKDSMDGVALDMILQEFSAGSIMFTMQSSISFECAFAFIVKPNVEDAWTKIRGNVPYQPYKN